MSPTAYPCWDGLRWLRVPSFEGACIGGDPLDCDKIPAVIFYQFNHIADLGHTGSIQQSNGLSLVTLRLVYLLSIAARGDGVTGRADQQRPGLCSADASAAAGVVYLHTL